MFGLQGVRNTSLKCGYRMLYLLFPFSPAIFSPFLYGIQYLWEAPDWQPWRVTPSARKTAAEWVRLFSLPIHRPPAPAEETTWKVRAARASYPFNLWSPFCSYSCMATAVVILVIHMCPLGMGLNCQLILCRYWTSVRWKWLLGTINLNSNSCPRGTCSYFNVWLAGGDVKAQRRHRSLAHCTWSLEWLSPWNHHYY